MPSGTPMSEPVTLPACSVSLSRASCLSGSSLGMSAVNFGVSGSGSGVTGLAGSCFSIMAEPLGSGGGGGGGGL